MPSLTYTEELSEHLFGKDWRKESRTGKPLYDDVYNYLTELAVRQAIISEGEEALLRHIAADGYLGPILRDYLQLRLRGEVVVKRGNKRTDAQKQKEKMLVFRILQISVGEGLSEYQAITRLLDEDAALSRKSLERLVGQAKKVSRWGLGGLYNVVVDGRARRLVASFPNGNQYPYHCPSFEGKLLGQPSVMFPGSRS